MNELARAIIIAAVVLGGALVVRGTFGTDRYELVPSVGGAAYRLDRLTGGVSFCTPNACRELPMLVPVAPTAPGGEPPPPRDKLEPPKTDT